jgi:hypothetical protein
VDIEELEEPLLPWASSLPFYKPREGPRVHERERKRRKRKIERKEALELHCPSPLAAGLTSHVDEDGDIPMS